MVRVLFQTTGLIPSGKPILNPLPGSPTPVPPLIPFPFPLPHPGHGVHRRHSPPNGSSESPEPVGHADNCESMVGIEQSQGIYFWGVIFFLPLFWISDRSSYFLYLLSKRKPMRFVCQHQIGAQYFLPKSRSSDYTTARAK